MKRMKSFRFLWYLLIALSFTLYSCKSDEPDLPSSGEELDISFGASNVTLGGPSAVAGMQKAKSANDIECSDKLANYVKYKIDGGEFKIIPVFYIDGMPWTNPIKLSVGTHTLNEFLVYSENNTPLDLTDDVLLSATPHTGSTYASYVAKPLDFTFTVAVDKKKEVQVEVVCYTPKYFDSFGFTYFKFTEIKLKQIWFFADFCIKNKAEYEGSQYASQSEWGNVTGPFIDVPAIMKVEVWHNGVLQNTFSNSSQGEKLGVNYVDYVGQTDNYQLKLFILVRQGTNFVYKEFKTWSFADLCNIPEGTDGVIDGVLGDCYDPSNAPDFILAPWLNLPATLTYKITANPSVLGAYVDATLSNIPTGYDLTNGIWPSYCADYATEIQAGVVYDMDVYSSLYPEKLPTIVQTTKWDRINWLINHLSWYPGYHWYDVQQAIWLCQSPAWNGAAKGSIPAQTTLATKMRTDAETYGINYKIPTGGWATVILLKAGTLPNATTTGIQTVIVKVDP